MAHMSGHNKWAQIKRQKGATDAAKSKIWGKLSKRITVESRKANGDADAANVRSVVETAKKTNMPKENIDRAIKKGVSTDSTALEQITYETYGPGGAAILIETVTDSRNRTAQEIKHLLSKNGLTLAAQGSASWAFEKSGDEWVAKTLIPISESDSDALMKLLEIIDSHDDVEAVYTNAE